MGLESVNHISDLNKANPLAGDNVSQGDDHIRNIKKALVTDFPNINATVNATPTQLDYTAVTTLGTAEAAKALTASLASTITFNGMTVTDLGTVTTADINGGTLDGVAIGNSSRSSVKATSISANSSLVLATGATVTGIDDDDTMAADSASILPTQAAAKGYTDAAIAAILGIADASSASPGYLEFKINATDGILVNWGQDSVDGSGDGSDTFAHSYSSTPWIVVATPHGSGSVDSGTQITSLSTSGFSYNGPGAATTCRWIAIGPSTL